MFVQTNEGSGIHYDTEMVHVNGKYMISHYSPLLINCRAR